MNVREILAQRLRQRRLELGLKQTLLAQKVYFATSAPISAYERQLTEPRLDTLYLLAKALHCSVDWLMGLTDDKKGGIR